MKYTQTNRLRVLFFTLFFLVGTMACASSTGISPSPKASDTPQANLDTCLPHPDNYRLEITNLSDQSNQTKRSCNARGSIINEGPRELIYRVYRVNHYGAEETFGEKWLGAGFKVLQPGESSEYGRFHRCTGGNCGEGEWFYIEKISLYYSAYGCLNFALSMEEPHPESVIFVENPCDW